jgi:hypothetical protein
VQSRLHPLRRSCPAADTVIPRAPMGTAMRIAVVVAILTAARATWAGAPRACCFPGGACQVLSHVDCESAGGDIQAATTCADPIPCVGCCRSGDPTSCEDHVVERDCVVRPGLLQFSSPGICGSDGQCVTIPQGEDCTDPTQCATGFCADGVCCDTACTDPNAVCNVPGLSGTCSTAAPAPALTTAALTMTAALLFGGAVFALRRRA